VGSGVRGIRHALKNDRPDAVFITGWNSNFLIKALWVCRRLAIPTLVRGDSNVLAPRGKLKRALQYMLIRQFSAFLYVGELNKQLYERAGISSDRLFSCPHFVENERFSEQAENLRGQRMALRSRWKIKEEATCFLFVGKLIEKKRVMDFVQAIAKVSRKGLPVHALIVGDGEQKSELEVIVEENGLPISFTGFLNQNDIAEAYVSADCLVLPSDYRETWGLVVNEAMACGLTAIVSDQVGCGPDLIIEGVTGSIYPVGDVNALSNTMSRFINEPEKLKLMGEQAKLHNKTTGSIGIAVDHLKKAVSSIKDKIS
jgi:glycosyltransferase involved in cell wall biosynthesis